MGKTSKDRIIDTLGDLDDNGLNRFKDKLGDTSFQGHKIAKGELQDANIVTVACLLMRTYTEMHPAENAIAVLNDINQVQLANQLKEKIKDLLLQEPTPPGEIKIDPVGSDSVSLSWGSPAGLDEIPHSFIITYSNSVDDNTLSITALSNSTLISKLRPGIIYSFTATTVLENGTQSTSVSAAVYTKPSPPGKIKIDSVGSDSVSLSWRSPAGLDEIPHSFKVTYLSSVEENPLSITAPSNSTVLSDLIPGREYTFTVTTELVNGIQSTSVSTSVCTSKNYLITTLLLNISLDLINGQVGLKGNKCEEKQNRCVFQEIQRNKRRYI
ncbi:receptor-type tyrosine-protein phosphatase eta-like isoform X2 [Acipenser ruthenus]|uniref:receptor-type tyrosine-protein phosphatase eta-like isoform X2 n=1 Tax=Acipenser ruthenus TaxID=7906 RepID=UPI0027415BE2|nr:receptor-type tyrosine-protein phosphatase eta-like isoform X2 [Acipenser ruthenus]